MNENKVNVILGENEPEAYITNVFSDEVCSFLDDLSKWLHKTKEALNFSDLVSVAFWCRKGSIQKMKQRFEDGKIRKGRGLLFHIAPSNVPVNFAFSYFFGLLSGNSNIVRIPSKKFPQIDILCRGIKEILKNDDYINIRKNTMFVTYERDKEINDYYCGKCDGRIIWGGDNTIDTIRQSKVKPKTIEVVFADRYSFGVIKSDKIISASDEEISELAHKFYNDTYLMDQNACSTPHFILWYGEDKEKASEIFWNAVKKEEKNYDLAPIKAVDKYTLLCLSAMERTDIESINTMGNFLYVVRLNKIPCDFENIRGKFGLFFECGINSLDEISDVTSQKTQTMAYYGFEKSEMEQFIKDRRLSGIDRVVGFGSTLDIGIIWDGYDIISSLSKIIDIQ